MLEFLLCWRWLGGIKIGHCVQALGSFLAAAEIDRKSTQRRDARALGIRAIKAARLVWPASKAA